MHAGMIIEGPRTLEAAIELLSESDLRAYKDGRKTFKTDGNCIFRLIANPDRYGSDGYVKIRMTPTNFTPKKKKRKK